MPDQTTHYSIQKFRTMHHALRALEPYIKSPPLLRSGRDTRELLGLRPREALGNWLICAASNSSYSGPYTFTSDPIGGDGVILEEPTNHAFPTEHVAVILPPNSADAAGRAAELIGGRIVAKNDRGPTYCSGKVLIVFMETPAGSYYPTGLARQLPSPLHFDQVWLVGLQKVEDNGTYVYAVSWLHLGPFFDAPTFLVRVAPSFSDWTIERYQ